MRITVRRKTTAAERAPEGLPNSIRVFKTMTSKTIAKKRDQLEMESNRDGGAKTGKKRASGRNLERQNTEQREARLEQ